MNKKEKKFVQTVLSFYKTNGRHTLPWRKTKNPYYIIVSEVMLQQTQVSRVIEKYNTFIALFPTLESLANAPLSKVLSVWVGLGYNRRARFLQKMAQEVVSVHDGIFPKDSKKLQALPGIGPYTASAVATFAYNQPHAFIETNIRTVYFHHFFVGATRKISDEDLLPLVQKTIFLDNPRMWYWALMDYGSFLKSTGVRNTYQSTHYTKQKPFTGSVRLERGRILAALLEGKKTKRVLEKNAGENNQFEKALLALEQEALIIRKGAYYTLAV